MCLATVLAEFAITASVKRLPINVAKTALLIDDAGCPTTRGCVPKTQDVSSSAYDGLKVLFPFGHSRWNILSLRDTAILAVPPCQNLSRRWTRINADVLFARKSAFLGGHLRLNFRSTTCQHLA